MIVPLPFLLLEPWLSVSGDECLMLEAELLKEMRDDHVLARISCTAVARRCDCDDVLFITDFPKGLLAIVHLTWSGHPDQYAQWPHTTFFDSWEAFEKEEMLPEHEGWKV